MNSVLNRQIILAYQRLGRSNRNIIGIKNCHPERSEGLKPRIVRGFFYLSSSIATIELFVVQFAQSKVKDTLLLSVRYPAFLLPSIFGILYLSIIKIFSLKNFFMKQLLTVLVI